MEFSGRLLERGFWLYVWKISTGAQIVLYVGRTGDSSSPNAGSPFTRIGQHLDFRPNARGNAMARQLKKAGIDPARCRFEMIAVGPLRPEEATMDTHKASRDALAALEQTAAQFLKDRGYRVLGQHHNRKALNPDDWRQVEPTLQREFPPRGSLQMPQHDADRNEWISRTIMAPEFVTQAQYYRDAVLSRLLPTFDAIEIESNAHAETLFQQCANTDDPATAAEWAWDEAIAHYMSLTSAKQSILNLATSGLYHIFEQQITSILRHVGVHLEKEKDLLKQAERVLPGHGIEIGKQPSWSVLCGELRLAANTVKHGAGGSAVELFRIRPDLFRQSAIREDDTRVSLGESGAGPMLGAGLLISAAQFDLYATTLIDFWGSLVIERREC